MDRIHAWHEGGSGIFSQSTLGNVLSDRVDISLNNKHPYPDLAIFYNGTNDASDGSVTLASITDGSWRTNFEAQIQKLRTVGCNKFVICKPATATGQSNLNAQTVIDKENAINSEVNVMAGASDVFMYDAFRATGGHSPNTNLFGSLAGTADDRHPSRDGHQFLGNGIADVIL
jgi:lysophospholipase L1-like esterase